MLTPYLLVCLLGANPAATIIHPIASYKLDSDRSKSAMIAKSPLEEEETTENDLSNPHQVIELCAAEMGDPVLAAWID